ncbi:MAG: class I tRNA ligase family protein [Oscillospiraceae bacterium]
MLRADRVPVSFRRGPARRPSAQQHGDGYHRAARRRMQGYNVLFPIGWDAFGLPTENYAIKNHVHPADVTKKNIDHFRESAARASASPSTGRARSTPPTRATTKWTQWIFLQLLQEGPRLQDRNAASTGAPAASAAWPTRKLSPA